MALFRVDYNGRGELSERQQRLGQMMSRLQKLSEGYFLIFKFNLEYNIAIFITNQVNFIFL